MERWVTGVTQYLSKKQKRRSWLLFVFDRKLNCWPVIFNFKTRNGKSGCARVGEAHGYSLQVGKNDTKDVFVGQKHTLGSPFGRKSTFYKKILSMFGGRGYVGFPKIN